LLVHHQSSPDASKHWNGLVKDYYSARAQLLMTQALADAKNGRPLNTTAALAIKVHAASSFVFIITHDP
jgi:hypothetical protein